MQGKEWRPSYVAPLLVRVQRVLERDAPSPYPAAMRVTLAQLAIDRSRGATLLRHRKAAVRWLVEHGHLLPHEREEAGQDGA